MPIKLPEIGKLDKRVRIEVRNPVVPEIELGAGDEVRDWLALASPSPDGMFWASIEPISGREMIEAQQVKATTTHKIRVRCNPGFDLHSGENRIIFKGSRVFNLDSVTRDMEIMGYYTILATETRGETP